VDHRYTELIGIIVGHRRQLNTTPFQVERLKDGNIHLCFFSRSGYRPFINPHLSLGNLLLDITMFNFIPASFCFLLILGLGLGLGSVIGLGFGIGNLKLIS